VEVGTIGVGAGVVVGSTEAGAAELHPDNTNKTPKGTTIKVFRNIATTL
jgi:hypothetical protein